MRILLTGGAGYVGSACLRWLLANGHEPFAFDNLSEGNRSAVPEDRLVVGDISDCDALVRAMGDLDVEGVMHFAAYASVPDSIRMPAEYWQNNVVGTKNVLDAMRIAGIGKLVVSSTAATFCFDAPMPLTEESEQNPQVPYGTTKLAAEWMVAEYSRAYGIGYAILRYFNAAGADIDGEHGEDRDHESHLIPLILQVPAGVRDQVFIYGGDWETRDGTCVRDYIHTADLAQAHQLAIEKLEPGSGLYYNVGSGTGDTVLEVLRACEKACGQSIPHDIVDRRPGDPAVLLASPARLVSELGWEPRHSDLETIVQSAWRWHQKYPQGYVDKPVSQL